VGLFDIFKAKSKKVTIMPSRTTFTVNAGQTILEAGLAEGYAMPHSCKVGTCGECKSHKIEGKIKELINFGYVLEAEELQNDYILPCRSTLKSDVVLDMPNFELKRLHPPQDFMGTIKKTIDLTEDIKRVVISLDKDMEFDAGQYVELQIDEIREPRSYSFAIPPVKNGSNEIELFIRKVPNGKFTTLLFDGLLENKELKVKGPLGNFWLRDGDTPLICIGGGSGLAPLISILEDTIAQSIKRDCILFFGARTQNDLYVLEQIKKIEEKWQGSFLFVPVLSDEPENNSWTGDRGFVHTAIKKYAEKYIDLNPHVYLCGPPVMIDAATEVATDLGISKDNIYADNFFDSSNKKVAK